MNHYQDSIHAASVSLSEDTMQHRVVSKPSWVYLPPMKEDTNTVYTTPMIQDAPNQVHRDEAVDYFSKHGKIREFSYGDPLLHNAFVDSLTKKIEVVPFRPQGVAGDPLPYRFKNDDFVNIAVMISFFLMVWVIARSRYYLKNSLKNILHPPSSNTTSTTRTENELKGQIFLIFQTCFTLGVLVFDYVQVRLPDVFIQVSPYKILLLTTGLFALYYALKMLLYYCINSIFFERNIVSAWSETYLLSVLFLGVCLFPVALLVVYFDLDFEKFSYLFFFVVILSKIVPVYKSFSIFSKSKLYFFHIILYLCALEILPPLVLWRSLIYALNVLAAID